MRGEIGDCMGNYSRAHLQAGAAGDHGAARVDVGVAPQPSLDFQVKNVGLDHRVDDVTPLVQVRVRVAADRLVGRVRTCEDGVLERGKGHPSWLACSMPRAP